MWQGHPGPHRDREFKHGNRTFRVRCLKQKPYSYLPNPDNFTFCSHSVFVSQGLSSASTSFLVLRSTLSSPAQILAIAGCSAPTCRDFRCDSTEGKVDDPTPECGVVW